MRVQHFFHSRTSTLTYVAYDERARVGVVIDPVLDLDPATGRIATDSADAVLRFIDEQGLAIPYVLETHTHADHPSGRAYFRRHCGAKAAISARVVEVQRAFRGLLGPGASFPRIGSQFDEFLEHGVPLAVGPFEVLPIQTPGHTADCMSYLIEAALFVGDTLFQPDYGTARCDFPGGSPEDLYDSVYRLYRDLPDSTRVFTCHDYQPGGREVRCESSLWDQRASNVQLNAFTRRDDFVCFRRGRDATLPMPDLMLPSLRINLGVVEADAS